MLTKKINFWHFIHLHQNKYILTNNSNNTLTLPIHPSLNIYRDYPTPLDI